MKFTQITITHGITVNLGNYESERYDITLTAEVDEDYKSVADRLQIEAARLLALQLMERLDEAMIDRIKEVSIHEDRRLKRLDRQPEVAWIKRLYSPYMNDLEEQVKAGAIPDSLTDTRDLDRDNDYQDMK